MNSEFRSYIVMGVNLTILILFFGIIMIMLIKVFSFARVADAFGLIILTNSSRFNSPSPFRSPRFMMASISVSVKDWPVLKY